MVNVFVIIINVDVVNVTVIEVVAADVFIVFVVVVVKFRIFIFVWSLQSSLIKRYEKFKIKKTTHINLGLVDQKTLYK